MAIETLFVAAAFFALASSVDVESDRSLPPFTAVSVNSRIRVNITVDSEITRPSLQLMASKDAMTLIESEVWPSAYGNLLVLGQRPSTVVDVADLVDLGTANLRVPSPLFFISANAGAQVTADSASGAAAANSHASLVIRNWYPSHHANPPPGYVPLPPLPLTFTATSEGTLVVERGELEVAYVGASSKGTVVMAAQVQNVQIGADSLGHASVRAVSQAGVECSSQATISLFGDAQVHKHFMRDCGDFKVDQGDKTAHQETSSNLQDHLSQGTILP